MGNRAWEHRGRPQREQDVHVGVEGGLAIVVQDDAVGELVLRNGLSVSKC